jgi:dolichol-phosphate mannosyltransferase
MNPVVSIVIPVLNESGNILPLVKEITAAMAQQSPALPCYELIFVDDGSSDSTTTEIAELMHPNSNLNHSPHPNLSIRLVRHTTPQGKSTAIRHGVIAANADWIITCNGNGQNNPAAIPALLALAWARDRHDKILVCGVNVAPHPDNHFIKATRRCANQIRRFILGDRAPHACSTLQIFRRDGYLAIPFFTSLHRFMPALFAAYGHEVMYTPVYDRPRSGTTAPTALLREIGHGFYDLLGVKWLTRRTPQVQSCTEYQPVFAENKAA